MTLDRQQRHLLAILALSLSIIFLFFGPVGLNGIAVAQGALTASNIPFPNRAPVNPEISPLQVRWTEEQTVFKMTLWWERGFLWMEISYNSLQDGFENPPFICSESFFIRQDGRNYNHVRLLDSTDQVWCDVINDADRFRSQPPKVFRVTQNPSILPRADFREDFTLFFWLRRDTESVKVDVYGAGNDLGSDPGMRPGPDDGGDNDNDGDQGDEGGGNGGDGGGGSSAAGQGSCFIEQVIGAI
jgi:hypothetical protein